MTRTKTILFLAMILACPAAALAGVDGAIEDEYVKRLEGKKAVTKVDVKVMHIKKQVRGNRAAGGFGGENMDQMKDATIVTPTGVRYEDEAHARLVSYAPTGTNVTIKNVAFVKTGVEIELDNGGVSTTTVVFDLEKKLDGPFSDRETFEKMLASSLAVLP